MKKFIKRALRGHKPALEPSVVPLPPYGFFIQSSQSWDLVKAQARGYNAGGIFEKVKASLAEVRDGRAVYERDSVLFDEIQYSWPLLASLLKIQSLEGYLHVVDFGGSLGSTYYQNRSFLSLNDLKWSVVEQPHFVNEGHSNFKNKELDFFSNIDEALEVRPKTNVLLVSSTLQYLSDPWAMFNSWLDGRFNYIIFDRTTFFEKPKDLLTLQKVPPVIYDAEYPAWFLNQQTFLNAIEKNYEQLGRWNALGDEINIYSQDGSILKGLDKGFFYKAKELAL